MKILCNLAFERVIDWKEEGVEGGGKMGKERWRVGVVEGEREKGKEEWREGDVKIGRRC